MASVGAFRATPPGASTRQPIAIGLLARLNTAAGGCSSTRRHVGEKAQRGCRGWAPETFSYLPLLSD
jgi:hypothetical protein